MNKKFSTLLCASLLFSSAFSAVNAGNIRGYAQGSDAAAILKLDKAALSGVYQLRVGTKGQDGVLAIKDGKYVIQKTTAITDLQSSLWCITITEEGQGKEPIYDFVNNATGEFLAVSEADVQDLVLGKETSISGGLSVGETFGGWAFSSTYATDLEQEQPMFTYQEADHVLVLTTNNKGQLQVKKVLAKEVDKVSNAVKFTVFNAGTYVLSAIEINAFLKDNKNVLTFTPDAKADVNPFTSNAFVAKPLNKGLASDHNFVYVTSKANEELYLKFWWEMDSTSKRWHPYCKGGDGRKYFGNMIRVIDWCKSAQIFYSKNGGVGNRRFWDSEGITWSTISTSVISFRKKENCYFSRS